MKYRIRKEIDQHSKSTKFYLEKYEKRFIFFGGFVWKNAKEYWDICPPYTNDYFDTKDEAKLYLKQLAERSHKEIIFETEV